MLNQMPGFLDKNAYSLQAEYASSLDGDYLGKCILKNFLLHWARLPQRDFSIPIGRNGDSQFATKFPGDALVSYQGEYRVIEVKLARVSFQIAGRKTPNGGWTFSKCLETDKGYSRKYDILFAIGVLVPSLGAGLGLDFIEFLKKECGLYDSRFNRKASPHELDFLAQCGFLIMPRQFVNKKTIDLTVRTAMNSRYGDFFAWGCDRQRCRTLWLNALTRTV